MPHGGDPAAGGKYQLLRFVMCHPPTPLPREMDFGPADFSLALPFLSSSATGPSIRTVAVVPETLIDEMAHLLVSSLNPFWNQSRYPAWMSADIPGKAARAPLRSPAARARD